MHDFFTITNHEMLATMAGQSKKSFETQLVLNRTHVLFYFLFFIFFFLNLRVGDSNFTLLGKVNYGIIAKLCLQPPYIPNASKFSFRDLRETIDLIETVVVNCQHR